jgi:hypothetical protein
MRRNPCFPVLILQLPRNAFINGEGKRRRAPEFTVSKSEITAARYAIRPCMLTLSSRIPS